MSKPSTGRQRSPSADVTVPAPAASLEELEFELEAAVEVFLRKWGNTGWRDLLGDVVPLDDPDLLAIIATVSAIELDANFMRRKLRATGVVRSHAIQQYTDVWLSEEVDHGRAFDALVDTLSAGTVRGVVPGRGAFDRDPRALLAFPAMWAARPFRKATLAGYFVRGCLVEGQAIAIYGRVSRALEAEGELAGAAVVRRITAQEGRHLKLFTSGAQAVLRGRSHAFQRAVRIATERSFRPPGVDLFGRTRWAELMSPLLADDAVLADLVSVDDRLRRLPGFEDSAIVERWFADLFADHPEIRAA